jgi:hypothetical protein
MAKLNSEMVAALALLSPSPMPFEQWIADCRAAGISDTALRNWPAWKHAGKLATALSRGDDGFILTIRATEGGN